MKVSVSFNANKKLYNALSPFISSYCLLLQREIMAGLVNATVNENLLWTIERTVSNVFIPLLNTNCMGDKGSDQLLYKVKKELLPCLRSFTRLKWYFEAEQFNMFLLVAVPWEWLKWYGKKEFWLKIFLQKLLPSNAWMIHGLCSNRTMDRKGVPINYNFNQKSICQQSIIIIMCIIFPCLC